jgi:YidC/Oxa1 family membrane protein insertase
MEKRALIALALSFVVFLVFMYIGQGSRQVTPPPAPTTAPQPTAEKAAPAVPPPPAPPVAAPPAPRAAAVGLSRPAREVVVETPLYKAVFTELGGRLKSYQLKKYRESLPFTRLWGFQLGPVGLELERYHNPQEVGAQPKNLVRVIQGEALPLSTTWQSPDLAVPATLLYEASQAELTVKPGETATLQFTGVSSGGLVLTKTFKFQADSYYTDLHVQVANRTSRPLEGSLDLAIDADYTGEDAGRYGFLGFKGSVNNKLEDVKFGSLKEPKVFTGKVDWAGLDESYFLSAMVPLAAPKATVSVTEVKSGPMTVTLRNPETLAPGQESKLAFALYFGPMDLTTLGAQNLGLDRAVNFGWFDFISKPSLTFLKWLEGYVGNYGWAIIILTILIRLVFFYPNHKSYKSMKDMQKLQPKVAKIREKYKDDKETMNKELMTLYRTFKVNPMAGCLPMVLQLPVFIALYNVLGYAIELRHASFIPTLPFTNIVWLADLSAKDPLLITPVVMGATMFIQQKMTPSPGDPTQAKMMMFLPLIFTFLFLNFASGLVLYWLVNNILSIAQQYYTNKYLT